MINPLFLKPLFLLAKAADLQATKDESVVPQIVEESIAKALKTYVKAEAKHHELIEAHKLRMDRLESKVDDYGKELINLKNRIMVVEKKDGGEDIVALKADIDKLKKEVLSLQSTNLSTFLYELEDLPLKEDVALILDEGLNVESRSDSNKEDSGGEHLGD